MARKHHRAPSKLLIPLSYFSQLAGATTLIGTSTNILTSTLAEKGGYPAFGMFEFAHIGLLIFATGALYILLVGRNLLPSRRTAGEIADEYQMGEYVAEVMILKDSPLIGKTVVQSDLRRKHNTNVLEIYREGRKLKHPVTDQVLHAGDTLFIETSSTGLLALEEATGLGLPAEQGEWGGKQGLRSKEQELLEVVIGPTSDLINNTPMTADFHFHYNSTIIAIRHHGEILRERLHNFQLSFGDTLLLRGTPEALDHVKRTPGFIAVTEEVEEDDFRRDKTWVALAIIAGVVILAATGRPILVTAIAGSVLMVVTGCLKVNELHESIRWDIIFLLAGIIPLGLTLQRTGGAQLLADLATQSADHVPPLVILMIFYLATAFLAESISHTAAVVVMIPVGIATGETLGLDPRAFMLISMFAACMSFSTPVGYHTNAMIYGPGGYRFLDFTRVGAPLSLLMAIVTPIYVYFFWGL